MISSMIIENMKNSRGWRMTDLEGQQYLEEF